MDGEFEDTNATSNSNKVADEEDAFATLYRQQKESDVRAGLQNCFG